MNMIERVATAIEDVQLFINIVGSEKVQICRRRKDGGHDVVSSHPYDADGVVELRQAVRAERAKAAIEAMREPTTEMLESALNWHDYVAADETYPMARGVIRAVVGAALEEN